MVQRYDDWDKKRYKTTKSMPWWMRKLHIIQYIGWGAGFIWAFGGLYKMLIFPSREAIVRSLDPRQVEADHLRQNVEQREKALHQRSRFLRIFPKFYFVDDHAILTNFLIFLFQC